MISSAELLSNFEQCQRWGHWSTSWQRHKMSPSEMFHAAVRPALTEDTPDPGDYADEWMMKLAAERGLEVSSEAKIWLYRSARNHAAMADIIVTAIRQNNERWLVPTNPDGWISSAMLDPKGDKLRRFLAVSHWSEEREFFEKRSWYALGEMAQYRLPMQMLVAVLGPMSGGRRSGYFAKALLHPQGSELRFRRIRRRAVEGFRETWRPVWREEHDEIERQKWLQGMYDDQVLEEVLFVVNIALPEPPQLQHIRDLASRQLERLARVKKLPEKQLTTCYNPLHPCPFRVCCWSDPESKPEDGGYDPVDTCNATQYNSI